MVTDEEIQCTDSTLGDGKKYTHPSYGMVRIARQSGGSSTPLFGAEIESNSQICIEISEGDVTQNLGRNWYHAKNTICEVIMSPVQYAELISNPNTQGMPCTIKYTESKGTIVYKGIETQTHYVENRLEERVCKLKEDIENVHGLAKTILDKKTPLNKSEKGEVLGLISKLVTEFNSNLPFYEECFKENLNKQKSEAKVEVESYLAHAINQVGLKALEKPEVLALILKN